jgi:hypothetical protein
MPDTKKQHSGKEKNTDDKEQQNHEDGKYNVAKEVNRAKSQNETDLHTKNKITGAELDGPPD